VRVVGLNDSSGDGCMDGMTASPTTGCDGSTPNCW
jgi:hypothetical protein